MVSASAIGHEMWHVIIFKHETDWDGLCFFVGHCRDLYNFIFLLQRKMKCHHASTCFYKHLWEVWNSLLGNNIGAGYVLRETACLFYLIFFCRKLQKLCLRMMIPYGLW